MAQLEMIETRDVEFAQVTTELISERLAILKKNVDGLDSTVLLRDELDVINSHMTKVAEMIIDAEVRNYGKQGGNEDE
jgi:chromosome condensin MukBEF complex kleisin-like MukF subunit|tara:strand:+ start:317 stop:550 length:234 start_codon:yes stop_codon:yes gene_type:complete